MQITYNKAVITDHADQIVQNAAGMGDDLQDVRTRTGALLGEFSGDNAFNYAEHQSQFMQGFEHLIDTVLKFGTTVHAVVSNATETDNMLARAVPGV